MSMSFPMPTFSAPPSPALAKTRRPAVPRQLALQLRGSYEKLRERRCACARGEALIFHCQQQILEYEADPGQFARTYFAGSASNAFPVLASIRRARETLARYQGEIDGLQAELVAAEAECARTEQVVMARLAALGAPRPNWCRWPEEPHALEKMRKSHLSHVRLRPQPVVAAASAPERI
jgi:hypothetical protein